MFCLAPDCGQPAISLGLCIEHVQRPGRMRRMSRKRKVSIEALAEKYVAADDPLPGQWPGINFAMGRGLRKGGVAAYLRRWLLAHGTLPEGVHEVLWNKGENCMEIDFTRLQNDPTYPVTRAHPDYYKSRAPRR
jgi:hypothetical protein